MIASARSGDRDRGKAGCADGSEDDQAAEVERAGRYSGAYRVGECWTVLPAWAGAAGALQPDIGSALSRMRNTAPHAWDQERGGRAVALGGEWWCAALFEGDVGGEGCCRFCELTIELQPVNTAETVHGAYSLCSGRSRRSQGCR
jgi:hypothetical protein